MERPGTNESYFITDRCIACGTCLAVCRRECIAGGRPPFIIRRSYCDRCGLCAARCPVKAIRLVPPEERDRR